MDTGATPASRPPTIYDVARAAGVAPSTVSRAFARPGRVNADTAERIRQVAAELGYRANPMARALSTAHTRMLAVIVSDLANPIYAELVRGAQTAAAEAGYVVLVEDTRESATGEREAAERVLPAVEGLLLTSSRMSDATIRMLAKQKPVVVLNRVLTDVPSVVSDNARGTRRAVEHLGSLGHDAITYVAGPDASWSNGARWRAFCDGCHELDIAARRIGPVEPTFPGGLEAAAQLLDPRTTAVLAYNALIAVGVMRGLQRAGRRVPEDVSVVGFDNILVAALVSPSLTTVSAPLEAMGTTAMRNLMAVVGGASGWDGAPVVVPTKLTVRGSSGPRAQGGAGH